MHSAVKKDKQHYLQSQCQILAWKNFNGDTLATVT